MWFRDHFCTILDLFCPCLKSLPKAKLKNFEINCVDCVMVINGQLCRSIMKRNKPG